VLTRLTGAGALYLVAVCLIPTFLQQTWHVRSTLAARPC
jgi:preprotein translocase subunit SecY